MAKKPYTPKSASDPVPEGHVAVGHCIAHLEGEPVEVVSEAPDRKALRARLLTLTAEAVQLRDLGNWVNGVEVKAVKAGLIADHAAEVAEVVEALGYGSAE